MTGDELRAAYACAAEVLRVRRLKGEPVPPWLQAHYRQLDIKVMASRSGHETDCGAEESDSEVWISAREAGQILGRSKRQVSRIAASLDGEMVDGRWLFRRQTVVEYAEEIRDGTTGSGGGE